MRGKGVGQRYSKVIKKTPMREWNEWGFIILHRVVLVSYDIPSSHRSVLGSFGIVVGVVGRVK